MVDFRMPPVRPGTDITADRALWRGRTHDLDEGIVVKTLIFTEHPKLAAGVGVPILAFNATNGGSTNDQVVTGFLGCFDSGGGRGHIVRLQGLRSISR